MVMPIKHTKKVNTSLALDPKTIDIIDRERGDSSRSGWVNDLVLVIFDGDVA